MLTEVICRNAKSTEKDYKLADSGGLFLLIKANGSKLWQQKYRYLGKTKLLSFGPYHLVSLEDARDRRKEAKQLLLKGTDPAAEKKKERAQAVLGASNTFKAVAMEWFETKRGQWSEGHAENLLHRMCVDIFPYIGARPIAEIDSPELLTVLRKIEKRGAIDIAHRVRQTCGQIFRYGRATGRCDRDPPSDLKDALKTVKTRHFAAIDLKEIPSFLQALGSNNARLYGQTRIAIKLIMLTFVRTTELIEATWDEIDFEAKEWIIPGARMKMRKDHIVPLCRQTLELFKEQKAATEHLNSKWVFPSQWSSKNPMSNNTILFAIKRLGFKGRMTGHGFRALAMTGIKEKLGYRHEVVDRQLAHGHRNKVAAAYDRAQFLDERVKMMQEWADYIDAEQHKNVVLVKFRSRKRAIKAAPHSEPSRI